MSNGSSNGHEKNKKLHYLGVCIVCVLLLVVIQKLNERRLNQHLKEKSERDAEIEAVFNSYADALPGWTEIKLGKYKVGEEIEPGEYDVTARYKLFEEDSGILYTHAVRICIDSEYGKDYEFNESTKDYATIEITAKNAYIIFKPALLHADESTKVFIRKHVGGQKLDIK